MTTREEEFKQRFAAVMLDLTTAEEAEDRLLLGSLAERIAGATGARNWSDFKAGLTLDAFRSLLTTFQNQGNSLAQRGERQQVHAIEVLGVSLVAKTQMADPEIAENAPVLDQFIDEAITLYRGTQVADPVIQ